MSEIKVNSIKGVGATNAAITINNSDGTCTANITNNLSNRNLIINGDMRIAQRGTSSTSSGFQTVDRFAYDRNGTGAATQSQVADAPEGFKYSLKIDCTTAETSPAANVFNLISQRFEGQNLQHIKKGTSNAQSLTASFYVKGNAAATYTCELRDHDNTRFNSQTFNVTTSWSRVTLTFAPDTTGAFDSDNNLSLYLFFWLSAGSDYSGGTFSSNTWHTTNANRIGDGQTNFFDSTDRTFFLTGVQLEVSDHATDFDHRSFGQELALCQRYFYRTSDDGSLTNLLPMSVEFSDSAAGGQPHPVTMRAIPTVSFGSGVRFFSSGTGEKTFSINANRSGTTQLAVKITLSGATAGQAGTLFRQGSNGYIEVNSEL